MPPKQRGARRAATKTTNAQQPPQRQPEQQFPKKVKKFAEALAKEGIETVGINKIKSFLRMGSGVINVKFDSHIWDHSNRAPKRYTLHQITLIDLAFIFERNDILLLVMQECYSPDCSHCYEDPITGKRISYFAQTVSHLSPIDLSLLKQMLQLKDIDTQTMVPKFEGHTPRSLPLLSFLLVFPEIFDYESIELLVKAGADVNQPDEKGNPPLIYVMTNGWGVKMVSLFITYGLDVWNELIPGVSPISGSDKLDQKWSYLMCAQASGRLDALDELLEYMNKNDPTRTKALLNLKYDPQNLCYSIWAHSILKNNLGALKILLRYGKPIWCEQEKEQVQELLNSKAPEIASEFRRLLFGSEHFVQNDPTAFLFEYFRYLLQTNESNIEEKQIEKLLRLIEKIDDENKFQDCLYDIMQLKIPFDQKNRLLNQLAHHYKSFNSIYKNCSTPLTLAIVNNLEPEARWLLDNGADPNLFAPPYSASPLTLTILVDNNSSMMLLLNHPRILIDNMGPFIAAAMCGKMGTLQTLVLHAKNILRLSVFNQTAPIPFPFKEFISYSQKVYGSSTCTLYGAAIYSGSFKTFSYVVENMTDKSPLSAELYLMLIVDLNRARMLSHLIELEKKAESKPIQAAGTSLIVYAEQSGADKIAQLIKEYLLQFKTATAETPTTNTADPPVMSPSAFFSQIGMSK
ncbi:MAG: hypothetical protein KAT71_02095, partial [Gammaproteobacteria bacterium]|nr:hypothetical protein [Gammaproteobacteria bacterium]